MGSRAAWWLALSALLQGVPAQAQEQDWGEGEWREREEPPQLASSAPERSFTDEPVHVMASAGFGTLVGFVGLTLGYNVHDRLELGGGIGVNGSGAMGGPFLRFRPLVAMRRKSRTLHAVAVDTGLSVGGYSFRQTFLGSAMSHSPAAEHPHYHADRAFFLQLEVSWEMVNVEGVSLRAGAGGATLLNPGDIASDAPISDNALHACGDPPSFFPVMLFQLGTAL